MFWWISLLRPLVWSPLNFPTPVLSPAGFSHHLSLPVFQGEECPLAQQTRKCACVVRKGEARCDCGQIKTKLLDNIWRCITDTQGVIRLFSFWNHASTLSPDVFTSQNIHILPFKFYLIFVTSIEKRFPTRVLKRSSAVLWDIVRLICQRIIFC